MALSNRTCFLVNLRDKLRCRSCGRVPLHKKGYHSGFGYHHVRFQSHGGNDEPHNVALLCERCHTKLHQNKLDLPALGDLSPPAAIECRHCGAHLNSETVEMNCGWYECDRCRTRTHLFDHCGYHAPEESEHTVA